MNIDNFMVRVKNKMVSEKEMFFGESFFCVPRGFIQQYLSKKQRNCVTCSIEMSISYGSGMIKFSRVGIQLMVKIQSVEKG